MRGDRYDRFDIQIIENGYLCAASDTVTGRTGLHAFEKFNDMVDFIRGQYTEYQFSRGDDERLVDLLRPEEAG